MSDSLAVEFGPFRSFFWPIYRHEIRKVVPMIIIVFLACLCYSVLRNMKDSVVLTASGAEVIPFIKFWVLLPSAVCATIIFTKLSNRFNQTQVFCMITAFFIVSFLLFGFVLYPLRDVIHPHAFADTLEMILPQGCKGLIDMFRHWTFTGFYVLTELWCTIVMHVMFWGFANEVTTIVEAKRFYPVLAIFTNISAIIAGQMANSFSQQDIYNVSLPFGRDAWEQTLMILVAFIFVCGVGMIVTMRWLSKHVLNTELAPPREQSVCAAKPKKKEKLSIRESFSHLSNSNYLLCIAVLVLGYNLAINLVEVTWKSQLRQLYSSPSDIFTYLNNLTSCVGIISTLTAFVMARIISNIGWTGTALITPLIMFITSAGFFIFMIFQGYLGEIVFALTGATPLVIAVYLGTIHNCLSKSAKYSVFDTTKEMAFIPLSNECKIKGKAAIDGVGSRLGKSGGSLLQQGLILLFGSVSASAPYIAAMLIAVLAGWFVATKHLGKMFNELVAETTEREPAAEVIEAKSVTA